MEQRGQEEEKDNENIYATIIVVGTEILKGIIEDTNSKWLINQLNSLGVIVRNVLIIRDEIDEIANAIKIGIKSSNIVFITGGLGPTEDDVTREALSKALNKPLVKSGELLKYIKNYYYSKGKALSPERIKMAYIIEGAKILHNPIGIAPGQKIRVDDTIIYVLPGPPKELKSIFKKHILKELKRINISHQYKRFEYRLYNVGESDLAPILKQFIYKYGNNVYIKSILDSHNIIRIIVDCRMENCESVIEELTSMIKENFRECKIDSI